MIGSLGNNYTDREDYLSNMKSDMLKQCFKYLNSQGIKVGPPIPKENGEYYYSIDLKDLSKEQYEIVTSIFDPEKYGE